MFAVVQDGLMSNCQFSIDTEVMAGVGVAIPTWEIATGHVQANAMSSFEDIAGCPQINLILIGSSWLNERWSLAVSEVAIAGTDNAVREVLRITIGVNIDQACHEIGVGRA